MLSGVLVFLTLALLSANGDQTDINQMVDQLLQEADQYITQDGDSTFPLKQGIDQGFWTHYGILGIYVHFVANNGKLTDLSTIERDGDATVLDQGDAKILDIGLSLGSLDATFSYSLKATWGAITVLYRSGQLVISAPGNSFRAQIRLTYNGTDCKSDVLQASLDTLGDVQVTVSGLESNYADQIRSQVLGQINDIISGVNSKINSIISKPHPNNYLCQYVHFPTTAPPTTTT